MDKITFENVNNFSPERVFDCGQAFRWNKNEKGNYEGVAFGRAAEIIYDGNYSALTVQSKDADKYSGVWFDYFDLGFDYDNVKKAFSEKDEMLKKAIEASGNIRILRQELFETVISFIISANNNIPRIKGCIETLCKLYGDETEFNGKLFYKFPQPERLAAADPDEIQKLARVGYRAPYIVESAKKFLVEKPEISDFSCCNVYESVKKLRQYPGVGPKVANCILLFAGIRRDAFPVDVWVKRLLSELYGIENDNVTALECWGRDYFGEYAGIAQQYLFDYMRNTK